MILATLCYIRDNNKTLMLHRIKKQNDMHEGKWNGLGGKFLPGETPEECAIREIKEESGLDVTDPRLNGVISFPMFDGANDWFVFILTIDKFSGQLIESNEGDLEWIDNDKLFDLPLWDGDKIFIKWLDNKPFFSAKFVYENGRLLNYTVSFHE